MPKIHNADLVRYEYMVYLHIQETCKVSEILLTKDGGADMKVVDGQIMWIPVENLNVDLIDNAEKAGKSGEVSISKIRNRICGIFDAAPLDWKYAMITVGDNTKHNIAIAKMPGSPIMPVVFDIDE